MISAGAATAATVLIKAWRRVILFMVPVSLWF
jgi:hypothetical protein